MVRVSENMAVASLRHWALVIWLLLALIAVTPLAANSQGSPGKWVTLEVDAEDVPFWWPIRVSFDVDRSGNAYATYSNWSYLTQSAEVKLASVRGNTISLMTLAGPNGTKNDVLGSVTKTDSLGRVHVLVETGAYDGGIQWTNLEYYLISDQRVIENRSLSSTLNLNLLFWYWGYDMAVDSTGGVHIALADASNDLHYLTNAGGIWTSQIIGSVGDSGEGVSIAVDSRGMAHVSYINSTNNYHLNYATNSGGSWTTMEIPTDHPFPMSTSTAFDSSGHIFIGCVEWPENTSQGNSGIIQYVTNLSGTFQLVKTPFRSDLSGNSDWLSLDARGYVRIVHDGLVSTGPPLTNSPWTSESIPGGAYIKEDDQGHLHVFYVVAPNDYGILEYASNRFEDSKPPTEPAAVPQPGGATITWKPPMDSGGLPLLGYNIYYGIDVYATSLYVSVGPTVSSYAFANLSANRTYHFSIAPVTLAGVGENSSIVSTAPLAEAVRNVTGPSSTDHTLMAAVVVGITAGLVALGLVYALRRTARARLFTVVFTCWAIAIAAILPAYVLEESWNAEQQIWTETNVSNLIGIGLSSLTFDDLGRAHIAVEYGRDLLYLTNESGQWVSETIDTAVSPLDLSIVLDSRGFAHIAFVNNTSIYTFSGPLMYATNSGGNWSVSMIDNTSARACEMATGSNGDIHIGYSTEELWDVHREKYAVLRDDSWEIQTIEYNQDGPHIWSSSIAVNQSGDVRIAYSRGGEIRFASKEPEGWNLTSIGEGWAPKIAVDADGVTNVCYFVVKDSPGHREYSGVYAIQADDGWSLGDIGFSLENPVSFAFDNHNHLRLLSVQDQYDLVVCEGGYGNMTVSSVAGARLTAWANDDRPSMALDPSGEPVICAFVSRTDAQGSKSVFLVLERDISPFTATERLNKGWTSAQDDILSVWAVTVALTFLVFLATWRLRLWKQEPSKEEPTDPIPVSKE